MKRASIISQTNTSSVQLASGVSRELGSSRGELGAAHVSTDGSELDKAEREPRGPSSCIPRTRAPVGPGGHAPRGLLGSSRAGLR